MLFSLVFLLCSFSLSFSFLGWLLLSGETLSCCCRHAGRAGTEIPGGGELREATDTNLTLHCHQQNDSALRRAGMRAMLLNFH